MKPALLAFPRLALALTLSPRDGWDSAGGALTPRQALLWQFAGGAACVALLALRAVRLEDASRAFSGSGLAWLVALALAGQLLAYGAYILLAAAVTAGVARAFRPDTSYHAALRVVSYSTFPLLLGWMLRAAIAWGRPGSGLTALEGFRPFVEAVWAALALRADLTALWPGASGPAAAVGGALGLFWLWHFVTLWGGLRGTLRCPRAAAAGVLLVLVGAVVVGQAAGQAFGAHWHAGVQWTD